MVTSIATPLARGTRILDYLSFTVFDCTTVEDVLLRLGVDCRALEYGRYRYRRSYVSEIPGISVYYDGVTDGMGIHVQISGQGLRWLESMPSFVCWSEWISEWFDLAPKFARIDIAVDDLSGALKFDQVYRHVTGHAIATRAQTHQLVQKHGRDGVSSTLYLGSRQSESMLRVYDKGMERGGSSYLRFEFEFKHGRADMVARLLVAEGWDAVVGHCRTVVDFKDLGHVVKNVTDRRVADWWLSLLESSRYVLNKTAVAVESVARLYGWLRRQVAQSVAVLFELDGGCIDCVLELAKEGRHRWTDKHRRLANMPVTLAECCH